MGNTFGMGSKRAVSNEKFNVVVLGLPHNNPLLSSTWDLTPQLTDELHYYLSHLGYSVTKRIPPPGFGGPGGPDALEMFAALKDAGSVISILFGVIRGILRLWLSRARYQERSRQSNSFDICINYSSDVDWRGTCSTDTSYQKLQTMLQAGNFAYYFLSKKYPNFRFNLMLEYEFTATSSRQTYMLNDGDFSLINRLRLYALFRQTNFQPNLHSTFSLNKKIFIVRDDYYDIEKKDVLGYCQKFYFLIPSTLLMDFIIKAKLIYRAYQSGV